MIFTTERFQKEFSTLDDDFKSKIIELVFEIKTRDRKDVSSFLASQYKGSGKSKWGIGKTLYHLYPQDGNSQHRLFYCFASDLNNEELMKKSRLFKDDVIFIDYTKLHDQEDLAVKRYNKTNIDYLYSFEPPIDGIEEINKSNIPSFWFRLTEDQEEIFRIKQPASVKGSAGTGKTFISFELFKDWIIKDKNAKLLYLTYTEKLLNKAKDTLTLDGLDINRENIDIIKFDQLLDNQSNKVIDETESRAILKDILKSMSAYHKNMQENILLTDYFVYSYIRGLIKGRVEKSTKSIFLTKKFENYLKNLDLGLKMTKIRNIFIGYLTNNKLSIDIFKKELLPKITSGSKDRKNLTEKLTNIFNDSVINVINKMYEPFDSFDFIDIKDVIKELKKDNIDNNNIDLIIDIYKRYETHLNENKLLDDNDYAKIILNNQIDESKKYDGIIIDEVQDLTEIQIFAITKLLKDNSNNISFFGDPNQTINPTIYHYGRFNSYLWQKNENINQSNLKRTHRCGQNLLDYINHLVDLRKEFKLTTNTEDLEKEESARLKYDDGHFACLIEDQSVIDSVFENLKNALDYYLIVDSNQTKDSIINYIKELEQDEYDENIEEQIITVQESKGLESSTVIMYNIISDNINIFNNLLEENNKISSMTFNKFYVSVTRARNSVIICETNLKNEIKIKDTFFYTNGNRIPEDIKEDDVYDYLEITTDPERFYDQATSLLEKNEYEKAYRKSNIALRHFLNQFDKDEDLKLLTPENILNDEKYIELTKVTSSLQNKNIETFESSYYNFINYIKVKEINKEYFEFINKRFEILKDSLRIRKIYEKRKEFFDNIDIWDDKEKLLYHEDFILLKDYKSTIDVLNTIDNKEESKRYKNLVDYLFGNTTFEKVKESFVMITYINDKIYKMIVDNELENVFNQNITNQIEKLRGALNETIS